MMPVRKLKPIEERDPYAAAVLDAFDKLEPGNMLHFDPCPWHRDTAPSFEVSRTGHRDEPVIYVRVYCPKCGAAQLYYPSDRELQEDYENPYSLNLRVLKALLPKLATAWNWRSQ